MFFEKSLFKPRAYQQNILNALDAGVKRAVWCCHRRCLAKGTHITLSDGNFKPIEDIKEGDRILSFNGHGIEEDTVTGIWSAGIKETIENKVHGSLPIQSTPDHKFAFLRSDRPRVQFKGISNAYKSYLNLLYDGIDQGRLHNPDLAEFLGYMRMDGYCADYQQPKFTNTNEIILKRVEVLADRLFGYKAIWRKKGNGFDLGFSNGTKGGGKTNNLIKELFRQDNNDHGKRNATLPSILWEMDKESIGRFFSAIISCDGCIYSHKKDRIVKGKTILKHHEVKLSCGRSIQLAWGIYWLLRKFGIKSQRPITDKRNGSNWCLRIMERASVLKLLSFGVVYGKEEKQAYVLDKLINSGERKRYFGLRGHLVKLTGKTQKIECFDIETENNHNFFANGYLVHNSGKDLTIWNWVIAELLYPTNKKTCFYIFPTYSQAKKVLWNSRTREGIGFLDYVPKEAILKKSESELSLTLYNGSYIQLIGSDNIDRLVGTAPNICVFSEAALQSERAWNLIRPILLENNGQAIFISTPRSTNWFYDLYRMAKNNPDWFCEKLSIEDTGAMTKEQVEAEIREGMSEELAKQEFYVSFIAMEGSYYLKDLDKMRRNRQIGNVPFDSGARVNTAWDLGIGDATAICFFQILGNEIHFIDYYEAEGEALSHYANVIERKAKDNGWLMGQHYAPHDAANRELSSGVSRQQTAAGLGLNFIILPTLKMRLADGIECVRGMFPRIWIDEVRCERLLKCLENYCKDYDDKRQIFSERPRHNWASHGSDSFRYACLAVKSFGNQGLGMSREELYEINARSRRV